MKRKKNNHLGTFQISSDDTRAILSALPLVTMVEADTPAQTLRNEAACASAGQKLSNHDPTISAEEIRVISVAINIALLLLSGKSGDYFPEIDPEWKTELNGYFFTLNRLAPIFDDLVAQIASRQ